MYQCEVLDKSSKKVIIMWFSCQTMLESQNNLLLRELIIRTYPTSSWLDASTHVRRGGPSSLGAFISATPHCGSKNHGCRLWWPWPEEWCPIKQGCTVTYLFVPAPGYCSSHCMKRPVCGPVYSHTLLRYSSVRRDIQAYFCLNVGSRQGRENITP